MHSSVDRRRFLKTISAAALSSARVAAEEKPVRVGILGSGGRGTGLLGILLSLKNVLVPAICDISENNLGHAQNLVEQAGQARPEGYSRGEHDFERLLQRNDLDAVLIASPWEWHTPMAVAAMQAGKYAAVEVPCALTYDQCWQLVDTHERTKVPCMMLENWSFRRDNLAVLNMVRAGLFGQMVHCHCAHSHDCIDHWFWDKDGNARWPARYLIERNADQYPTHALGPVLSWLDINCGDAFAHLTSTATDSRGINDYFARTFGPNHPNAKLRYAQGDIVTSVVRTHKGRSIVINYDMQLPRPYDNRWMAQGTLGVYEEDRSLVYLHGRSPRYQEWEPFAPYQEQYEHSWWKELRSQAAEVSHGGTDLLELREFVRAVRNKTQTPIDVYDSVTMSAVIPLSEESIRKGGTPIPCPDFTRGRWQTRKPSFALCES
jgi:predicted dehydrogenase